MTEGIRTEVEYFKGLAAHLRATATTVLSLDVCGLGRDPLSVVQRAHDETQGGELIGQRDGFDQVWCVFDVDHHHRTEEAIAKAAQLGINVALSNPCFEIWLLWHFEDYAKHIDAPGLARRLRKHGFTGKGVVRGFDYSLVEQAERRVHHQQQPQPNNPGTGVHRLTAFLRASSTSGRRVD